MKRVINNELLLAICVLTITFVRNGELHSVCYCNSPTGTTFLLKIGE